MCVIRIALEFRLGYFLSTFLGDLLVFLSCVLHSFEEYEQTNSEEYELISKFHRIALMSSHFFLSQSDCATGDTGSCEADSMMARKLYVAAENNNVEELDRLLKVASVDSINHRETNEVFSSLKCLLRNFSFHFSAPHFL